MIGLGLPMLIAWVPVAVSKYAMVAPQPGRVPFRVGQFGVQVGCYQLRAIENHLDGKFQHFERDGSPFTDNHIVRLMIDDCVTVAVEGRQQTAFADDKRSSSGLLPRQIPGGGHRAGKYMSFLGWNSEACQLGRHVASRALTVIREEQKGNVLAL